MQNKTISKLLYRQLTYENKKSESYSKLEGPVKYKRDSTIAKDEGTSPTKVYAKFHKKGRILAFYQESPPNSESQPIQVIFVSEIKDIQEGGKNKTELFKLILPDEEVEVKLDDPTELADWVKTLRFFKDLYGKEKGPRKTPAKGEIDSELLIYLMGENELSGWDAVKTKYDYTGFFKDKNITEVFNSNPLPVMSNRILISYVKQGDMSAEELASLNPRQSAPTKPQANIPPKSGPPPQGTPANRNSKSPIPNKDVKAPAKIDPKSVPPAKTGREGKEIPDKPKARNSKIQPNPAEDKNLINYLVFLTSQRPLSEMNEDAIANDYRNITKAGFPTDFEFNTLYLYEYSKAGDTNPAKIAIPLK